MSAFAPVQKFAMIAAIFCTCPFITTAAEATCVRNDTSKNLYVILSAKSSRVERTFVSGGIVCVSLGKGEKAKVNVLPFSGARFGCRTEVERGQTVGLDQFGTMNKCHFKSD